MESRRQSKGDRRRSSRDEDDDVLEEELDELCSSLLLSNSEVREPPSPLPDDFVPLDDVPPFECFATQIRGSEAKQKVVRDLKVSFFF